MTPSERIREDTGRHASDSCVEDICPVCRRAADAERRIVEDTGRLYRLFLMIDGRRKFPRLFTQPKWEGRC